MTRPASDVLADLAALASDEARIAARRAHLHGELARALAAAPAPAAAEPPEYLTTREAAALLGVSVRTLEGLRASGAGPRFVRVGRAVRYPRDTVQLPSGESFEAPSAAPRSV